MSRYLVGQFRQSVPLSSLSFRHPLLAEFSHFFQIGGIFSARSRALDWPHTDSGYEGKLYFTRPPTPLNIPVIYEGSGSDFDLCRHPWLQARQLRVSDSPSIQSCIRW